MVRYGVENLFLVSFAVFSSAYWLRWWRLISGKPCGLARQPRQLAISAHGLMAFELSPTHHLSFFVLLLLLFIPIIVRRTSASMDVLLARSRSWYKLRSRSSDADCCWLRVYTGVNWGDHCAGVKVDGNCTSVLYPVQRHMLLTFIEASYMQISTDFLLEQAKNVCGLLPSRRRRTDLLDGFNSAYSVVVALLILL
jgi:hypothetical protein